MITTTRITLSTTMITIAITTPTAINVELDPEGVKLVVEGSGVVGACPMREGGREGGREERGR